MSASWQPLRKLLLKLWLRLEALVERSYRFIACIISTPYSSTTPLQVLPTEAFPGSTAMFFRVQKGIVLKAPFCRGQDQKLKRRYKVLREFQAETEILKRLGRSERIVEFIGERSEYPSGILFREAEFGNLQQYLDRNETGIPRNLGGRWSIQCSESVAWLHERGVTHNDLRPENYLIYGRERDLCLCDFGGASCAALDIPGVSLPDSGFFDPSLPPEPSVAMDIFSVGSVLYAIVNGTWPFREEADQKKLEYDEFVDDRFARRAFPDVDALFTGNVIMKCWTHEFLKVQEVSAALRALFS